MELAESSQGSMGNPMETGTKTQTYLSSQSSNPHCRVRHQSPNDTHPTYNDSNCLQESLGGHGLVWNKSLKTPGEGAMKIERGSAICLHENVPWLKVAWHIQGTYKKPLFFFPYKKGILKCVYFVKQKRQIYDMGILLLPPVCCQNPLMSWDMAPEFYTSHSRNSQCE